LSDGYANELDGVDLSQPWSSSDIVQDVDAGSTLNWRARNLLT